jgi:hypothetical protein
MTVAGARCRMLAPGMPLPPGKPLPHDLNGEVEGGTKFLQHIDAFRVREVPRANYGAGLYVERPGRGDADATQPHWGCARAGAPLHLRLLDQAGVDEDLDHATYRLGGQTFTGRQSSAAHDVVSADGAEDQSFVEAAPQGRLRRLVLLMSRLDCPSPIAVQCTERSQQPLP